MGMKVAKFGGSSLADAAQFKKVREILLSDADRHIVVPSAPGKRSAADIKVTDLFMNATAWLLPAATLNRHFIRFVSGITALPTSWAEGGFGCASG